MIIEQEGKTVDEAIEQALKKIGLPREKVKIEIMNEAKKGVFGLGGQSARVIMKTLDEKGAVQQAPGKEVAAAKPAAKETEAAKSSTVEFLDKVLKGINLEATFRSSVSEDGQTIEIISSDSSLLIGKKGKNLDALQLLANVVVNRNTPQEKRERIILDTESYRVRRKETLLASLGEITQEVKQSGKSVSLEPMSPHERKIIHLALKDDPDLTTESSDEGENRHVVIKLRK